MRKRTAAKKKRVRPKATLWVPPERKEAIETELEDFSELFRPLANYKQRAFLMAYVRTIGIRSAMRLSGVARHDHYFWLKTDARYRATFEEAQRMIADLIEDEVLRRAAQGHDTPVVYRGDITGWYKSYSDRLALSVLKALKPKRYHRLPDDGWPGGPTEINIRVHQPGAPALEPKPEADPPALLPPDPDGDKEKN
jgi:hypothetical protein